MKTSDVIKRLKEDIKKYGDKYVREFKCSDEVGTHGFHMVTDKDEKGRRKKMTIAQFREWVKGKEAQEEKL
jgi:hypothetical protein